MRRLLPLALLALAARGEAQTLFDPSIRTSPQFVRYELAAPINRTITQFAVPLAAVFSIVDGLNIDIATAYARSTVETRDDTTSYFSQVDGLTDTQVRANYSFGNDAVVLTLGVNVPTGHSTVTDEETAAAGQIGSDFLAFPISNMGIGLAATGGIAVARQFGDWSVGAGGSFRRTAPYEPFDVTDTAGRVIRYQPGDEARVRIGVQRPLFGGQLGLGFTASAFTEDEFAGSLYSTGDRYIAQASFVRTIGGVDYALSGWNLYRAEGETSVGVAPWENIANVLLTAAISPGSTRLDGTLEYRAWSRAGANIGRLAGFGLRGSIPMLGLMIVPSAGYSVGQLSAIGATANVSGFRGSLGVRWTP